MPDDFRISDLPSSLNFNAGDLMEIAQENSGSDTGFSSVKKSMTDLATLLLNTLLYSSSLQTTSKTIIGAINELAQGGGGSATIMIGTTAPSSAQGTDGNLYVQYTEGTGGASDTVDAIYVKLDGEWCEIETGGSLGNLSDVNITALTLSNGQFLIYNSTSGKWENKTKVVDITQAGYDALVQGGTVDPDVYYNITDGVITANDVQYSSGVSVAQKITAVEGAIPDISGKQDIIAKGGVTSLDANTLYGSNMTRTYRCVSSSITNCPQTDGTLMVFANGDGNSTVQMFISSGGGALFIRTTWAAGSVSWGTWKQVNLT